MCGALGLEGQGTLVRAKGEAKADDVTQRPPGGEAE